MSADTEQTGQTADGGAGGKNPQKKGKPTPKRRDQERARGKRTGPVAPPITRKEARERRRSAEAGMDKEQRKAHRAKLREERRERQRLMQEGDERYVLSRDKGDVRRFARNWVDTNRRLINLFMPLAIVVIIIQLMGGQSELAGLAQMAFFGLIILVVTDGIMIGRTVNRLVRERFPETEDTGFSLGFYAAMRASQPRMLRSPRPQFRPGDPV